MCENWQNEIWSTKQGSNVKIPVKLKSSSVLKGKKILNLLINWQNWQIYRMLPRNSKILVSLLAEQQGRYTTNNFLHKEQGENS